jgi:hypothetical protein
MMLIKREDRMSLSQNTDVLIVGAGMAGVTTAWALRQVGIRSIVLEAQNRIGGRIQTSRKWKNLPCDMGAGWVSHPTINPLVEMARRKKIKLSPSELSNIAIHRYSKSEIEWLWGVYGAAYMDVKCEAGRRRDQGQRDVGLSRVFPGVLDQMDLDLKTRRGVEFFIDTSITQALCRRARAGGGAPEVAQRAMNVAQLACGLRDDAPPGGGASAAIRVALGDDAGAIDGAQPISRFGTMNGIPLEYPDSPVPARL